MADTLAMHLRSSSRAMFITMFRCGVLVVTLAMGMLPQADGTSSKMDYLALADVRVDPMDEELCVSDHIHTFYGANVRLSPDVSFAEMRVAEGSSGNVEENKSLYWHPTVYEVDVDESGQPIEYRKAPIWFASSYYVWPTGETRSFPQGFKMIARGSEEKAEAEFECVGQSRCERGRRDCDAAIPGSNFPASACYELEVSLVFPNCWDGESVDSPDHASHVAYTEDGDADGDCPESHPVRLPQLHWYFRIREYKGGRYEFSDGTSMLHADYMSGWDETELQSVLDDCENDSFAAMPDEFCEDFFTFKDGPKDGQRDDEDIADRLAEIQPQNPFDPLETVSEAVDRVPSLPRGICNGVLLDPDAPPSPTEPLCTVSEWSAWPDTCPCCENTTMRTLSRAAASSPSSSLSFVSRVAAFARAASALSRKDVDASVLNDEACTRTRSLIILVQGTSEVECLTYLNENEPGAIEGGLSQGRSCLDECDAPPAPGPSPPPGGGVFVVSKKGEKWSCDRTCTSMDKRCVPERMAELRDRATLQAAMTEAGGPTCNAFAAGRKINRKNGVPGYRVNKRGRVNCFASGDSLGVETRCSKNVRNVFSLCYCE